MESAGAGIELLPDGKYDAEVKSAKSGKTSTQKDKIAATFVILTGPNAGKTFYNDFVITPESSGAMGFFFQHMKVLGAGPEFFKLNPSLDDVAQKITGGRAVVTLGHRPWQGEMRNNIDKLQPSSGVAGIAPSLPGGFPAPAPAPVAPAPQPAAPAPAVLLPPPPPF